MSRASRSRRGLIVTVIAQEEDVERFELSPEEEQALLASLAEAERGETVDGEEVLRRLDSRDRAVGCLYGYPACGP